VRATASLKFFLQDEGATLLAEIARWEKSSATANCRHTNV
jgi:hypothetical protein